MHITLREIEQNVPLPKLRGNRSEKTVEEIVESLGKDSRGRKPSPFRQRINELKAGESFRIPGHSPEKAQYVSKIASNVNKILDGTGLKIVSRKQGRDIRVWAAPIY